MVTFHFVTPKEIDKVKTQYIREYRKLCSGKAEIETLLKAFPEAGKGAEEFFLFLKEEKENREAYEKKHGSFSYKNRPEMVPQDVTYYDETGHRSKTVLHCLERYIGEACFNDYIWNLPETQAAYTKTKVAGADWYKQFDTNPDGAVDYLDNLKDQTRYGSEYKKIEEGKKSAKNAR